jgi:hypothetical protein
MIDAAVSTEVVAIFRWSNYLISVALPNPVDGPSRRLIVALFQRLQHEAATSSLQENLSLSVHRHKQASSDSERPSDRSASNAQPSCCTAPPLLVTAPRRTQALSSEHRQEF